MNKKSIKLFSFFSGLFLLSTLGVSNNTVEASTTGTSYGGCSSPSSKTVYESTPSAGSSSQRKDVHTHPLVTDYSKPIKDKNGKITGYGTKPGEKTVTTYPSCSSYLSSTSGSAYSGAIYYNYRFSGSGSGNGNSVTHTAYYITSISSYYSPSYKLSTTSSNPSIYCTMYYPNGATKGCPSPYKSTDTGKVNEQQTICKYYSYNSRSDNSCYNVYYPIRVTITVTSSSSNTSVAPPTFNCVVTYKNYDTTSCTSSMTKSTSTSNSGRTIKTCYSYSINGYSDKTCTERHHLKEITITGASKTYSGIRTKYYCSATFANNSTLDLTYNSAVWSATPYNHIGLNNHPGYKRPLTTNTLKPTTHNEFYPTANVDTNYTIKCAYNPYKSNSQVSDSSSYGITKSFSVANKGISEMYTTVSGSFYNPSSPGNFLYKSNLVSPDATDTKYVPNSNFLTAGWYDFRAYIKYTDGTNGSGSQGYRDVTNAPETLWTQSGKYPVTKTYNTNLPDSGVDNRIPVNGRNEIYSMYLYTGNPGEIVTNNRVRDGIVVWARQIVDLEIKGDTYATPAKTTVNGGETVGYTAWVTFSDDNNNAVASTRNPFGQGVKENWTSGVTWKGDYKLRNGVYKFPRGDKEDISIYAFFEDTHSLKDTNKYWDKTVDYKNIKIVDNCNDLKYIVPGCAYPTDLWNVTGYETIQDNYLPPAKFYGYTAWNEKNDPYRFVMKFKVTGISNGIGD